VFDYVVVGAGITGCVMAEQIARVLDRRVLLIEQLPHIGGACFDRFDEHGVLIHQYGPHLFHTSKEDVWQYLSRFTEWLPYRHRVMASVDGKLTPVPFNLTSLRILFPDDAERLEATLLRVFGAGAAVTVGEFTDAADPDVRRLGRFVIDKIYRNYTAKQWGRPFEAIDPSVINRVKLRISHEDGYFTDPHQAMPKDGYTRMMERMLADPRIEVRLDTERRTLLTIDASTRTVSLFGRPYHGHVVYTGAIDELFDRAFGVLPYRAIRYEFERHPREWFQPTAVINYPNEHQFTRITEFKYFTGQVHPYTTVVKEYPREFDPEHPDGLIPSYPVPGPDTERLYNQYLALARRFPRLLCVGRLAEYRYYNVDDAVGSALRAFARLQEEMHPPC
jgi:UDP-galactopyranose mutase